MADQQRFGRIVYKSLLRASKKLDTAITKRNLNHYSELCKFQIPLSTLNGSITSNTSATIQDEVRRQFRQHANYTHKQQDLLSYGVRAIRQANDRANELTNPDYEPRPAHVKFHIGQVAMHRLYQYKFVIYGWDKSCKASDAWMSHMGVDNLSHGRDQAFYHCLADTNQRGKASVCYIAQDNIVPLQPTDIEETVENPLLHSLFSEFIPQKGYLPSTQLQSEYPEDTPIIAHVESNFDVTDMYADEIPPNDPLYLTHGEHPVTWQHENHPQRISTKFAFETDDSSRWAMEGECPSPSGH